MTSFDLDFSSTAEFVIAALLVVTVMTTVVAMIL
jgi:hypothetical protein